MSKRETHEGKAMQVVDSTFYDEFGNKIAYEITDAAFAEPLKIKWSANAWWMELFVDRKTGERVGKVHRLIEGFKQGYTVEQACILAGITRHQWEYFNQQHQEFSGARERCKHVSAMFAKTTINAAARKDWKAALALLQVLEPENFGIKRAMGDGATQPQTIGEKVASAFFDEKGDLVLNDKMNQYLESLPKPDAGNSGQAR